jgi:hypothetical protein
MSMGECLIFISPGNSEGHVLDRIGSDLQGGASDIQSSQFLMFNLECDELRSIQ